MKDYAGIAKVFKALDDEKRLQILDILRTGERCACVLLEDIHVSQSTLSHHMKILCESGLVRGCKDGKWVHYSIDPEGSRRAAELLAEMTGSSFTQEDICQCKRGA